MVDKNLIGRGLIDKFSSLKVGRNVDYSLLLEGFFERLETDREHRLTFSEGLKIPNKVFFFLTFTSYGANVLDFFEI